MGDSAGFASRAGSPIDPWYQFMSFGHITGWIFRSSASQYFYWCVQALVGLPASLSIGPLFLESRPELPRPSPLWFGASACLTPAPYWAGLLVASYDQADHTAAAFATNNVQINSIFYNDNMKILSNSYHLFIFHITNHKRYSSCSTCAADNE